jgi:hypothetical protein
VGFPILQVNADTGEVEKRFSCIMDVQKIMSTSRQTIKRVLASGEVFRGFKWLYLTV